MPAAQGWNVVRAAGQNGHWNVNAVTSLEETVPLLNGAENVVQSANDAEHLRCGEVVRPNRGPHCIGDELALLRPYQESGCPIRLLHHLDADHLWHRLQ